METFSQSRLDDQLKENLKTTIEQLKDPKAIGYAQYVINLLEPTVTSERAEAPFLDYQDGPGCQSPSDEMRMAYNLIQKTLGSRLDETASTPGMTVYQTDIKELTIRWFQTKSDTPGVINNNFILVRDADIK